jgi:hypothetical protein
MWFWTSAGGHTTTVSWQCDSSHVFPALHMLQVERTNTTETGTCAHELPESGNVGQDGAWWLKVFLGPPRGASRTSRDMRVRKEKTFRWAVDTVTVEGMACAGTKTGRSHRDREVDGPDRAFALLFFYDLWHGLNRNQTIKSRVGTLPRHCPHPHAGRHAEQAVSPSRALANRFARDRHEHSVLFEIFYIFFCEKIFFILCLFKIIFEKWSLSKLF